MVASAVFASAGGFDGTSAFSVDALLLLKRRGHGLSFSGCSDILEILPALPVRPRGYNFTSVGLGSGTLLAMVASAVFASAGGSMVRRHFCRRTLTFEAPEDVVRLHWLLQHFVNFARLPCAPKGTYSVGFGRGACVYKGCRHFLSTRLKRWRTWFVSFGCSNVKFCRGSRCAPGDNFTRLDLAGRAFTKVASALFASAGGLMARRRPSTHVKARGRGSSPLAAPTAWARAPGTPRGHRRLIWARGVFTGGRRCSRRRGTGVASVLRS